MKKYNRKYLLVLCIIFGIALMVVYIFFANQSNVNITNGGIFRKVVDKSKEINGTLNHPTTSVSLSQEITLAVVACGQRLQETLTMLKSAILFSRGNSRFKIIVVTERSLKIGFTEKLNDWKELAGNQFSFEIVSLKFPETNVKEWKSLFKPCAAQRLFLPSLLTNVDSILYLDTDTILLSPISSIWNHFKLFNSSQIAALSSEHEDKNVGWYNRFARHPFYGAMGVNSGVMLMNLTRMREFQWEEHILPIHKEYKLKITWGDQDLINILFYFHPDKLFVFPCEYNFRPDHCMYMTVCNATDGIQIMHGNRGYFHADKQPAFSTVFNTMQSYQLGTDPYRNFVLPLESALADEHVALSNCGKVANQILSNSKKIFTEGDYYYS